jgi:Zn-dependent protease
MGKTAMAGPATNIAFATILSVISLMSQSNALNPAAISWLNTWKATINLIPFGTLDGLKVFVWEQRVWTFSFALSAAPMIGLGIVHFRRAW